MSEQNEPKFFEIIPGIARLNLPGGSSYVVCGTERAIAIDNGYGLVNHVDYVRAYTDLPYEMMLTHAHFDHCRGNIFYDKAYMNPGDFPIYDIMFDKERIPEEFRDLPPCPLEPINDGDIIDLGGRHVEVIGTPGHTSGSVCFLVIEDKILITGDTALPATTWLLFPYSLTVREHNASLKKLRGMWDRYDQLLTGHSDGLVDKKLIDDLIEAGDAIMAGKTERAGRYTFGGHMDLPCYYYGDNDSPLVYLEDKIK